MFKKIILLAIIPTLLILGYFTFVQRKQNIYVYNDIGVSKKSLTHLVHSLNQFFPNKKIKIINAEQLIAGTWTKDARMLIIGGGADIPYTQKLNGAGNAIIKQYVANGGKYVGICAGAYYAGKYVEFDKAGPLQVLGERELSFFPGTVAGPVLASYDYKTNSGARAAKLEFSFAPQQDSFAYYNGGGYFVNAEQNANVEIIARYMDTPGYMQPAIIKIAYGSGTVILSGVHFEYDALLLQQGDQYQQKISVQLLAATNQNMFYKLLTY